MAIVVRSNRRSAGAPTQSPTLPANFGQRQSGIGEALGKIGGELLQAEERINTQQDAIEAAQTVTDRSVIGDQELRRLRSETPGGLASRSALKDYGDFLRAQKQEALNNYKGTAAGKARLNIMLEEQNARLIGRAVNMAHEDQRVAVQNFLGKKLNQITETVLQNPSNLPGAIVALGEDLETMAPAMTPEEQAAFLKSGRQEIVVSAVQGFLERGDVEAARNLFDTEGVADNLTPAQQRRVIGAIEAQERASNEAATEGSNVVAMLTAALGRPPTEAEIQARLGILKAGQAETPTRSIVVNGDDPLNEAFGLGIPKGMSARVEVQLDNNGKIIGGSVKGGFGTPQVSITEGPQIGSIPPGFQVVTDPETGAMRMEPIPGSPAAAEGERQTQAEAEERQRTLAQQDVVVQDVDRALDVIEDADVPVTGAVGDILSNIGGTTARDLRGMLDTIRANVGFDKLQAMREASPTGGALGQVSNLEIGLLQSVLGALDQSQSKEQLMFNLSRFRNIYLDIVHGPGEGPPRTPLADTLKPESVKQMGVSELTALDLNELSDEQKEAVSARLKELGF